MIKVKQIGLQKISSGWHDFVLGVNKNEMYIYDNLHPEGMKLAEWASNTSVHVNGKWLSGQALVDHILSLAGSK